MPLLLAQLKRGNARGAGVSFLGRVTRQTGKKIGRKREGQRMGQNSEEKKRGEEKDVVGRKLRNIFQQALIIVRGVQG